MNDNEMGKRLNDAFTHATPDILDSIITSCEDGKGKVIVMKKNTDYGNGRNSSLFKTLAVAALLVLFIGCGVGALSWRGNHMVVSTIALDVNPGIEIEVNKKEKVLEVKALNEEGKAVIGEMNLKGSDLDVAVNALIGSMLKNGYLSELANSILVSVECDDEAKAAELQARLTAEIESMFQNETFNGAVLSQTISKNEELQKQADAYEITAGKAQLIEQLVKQNTHYTFEELAALSINELNLLSESGNTHLENVESVGTASEKEYIGVEKAKEAAFAHAGVSANEISSCKVEMDYENKVMVYEIEFISGAYEYDYEINAISGAAVRNEKELKDNDDGSQAGNGNNASGNSGNNSSNSGAAAGNSSSESQNSYIGEAKAKEAALKHAGVTADSIKEFECKLDKENGLMVYEIEFKSGNYEYSYDINAETGAVVSFEKDIDD